MKFQNNILIKANSLSFVAKSATVIITKIKYTGIILNLIAVNFVNYLAIMLISVYSFIQSVGCKVSKSKSNYPYLDRCKRHDVGQESSPAIPLFFSEAF